MSSYRSFPTFGAADLVTFMRAVDSCLRAPARIVVIGGSAAAFHGALVSTRDVDTFHALTDELARASEAAAATTGLLVPVRHSAVADCPWNFEDRLVRQLSDLTLLEVWILEKHDLALSKSVRGDAHDEQQLRELHRESPLTYEVLVERFRDEMTHVVGDPRRIRSHFLDLVELLFGEVRRIAAAKAIGASWPARS